jgi:CO/xanthine dehydrogenase Mo-binding subunit
VEMGQGLHSVISLGIAEALGVRPEMVVMNQTDTGTCPWDVGTHASRGAFTALNAAIDACNQARTLIFEAAVDLYPEMAATAYKKFLKKQPESPQPLVDLPDPLTPDDFQLQDGLLTVKGLPPRPWLAMDLGTVIRAMHFRQDGKMLTVEAFYDPPNELPDWGKGRGNMSATYAYGTQGVEGEVDTDTGEVKILKLVAAHDVGTVLNPQTLRGQTYGALAQGLGYAMYEQVITDGGRIMNPDFRDYKIPTACEMDFPIEIEFIETEAENGPFGAKGVGEPGLVPTAPAIGNAIFDAVGVRIKDLPITPEKVLAALKAKKK